MVILHHTASHVLWHRPARPQHGRLSPEPGRGKHAAPHHESQPGALAQGDCPVSRRSGSSPSHGSFPGTGLAHLGARKGMACALGHALSLKALHGGQAKHDTSAADTIAVRLRGGTRPQGYAASPRPDAGDAGPPAAAEALWGRQRAAPLAHVQQTNCPDPLPALSTHMAYKAKRDGLVERLCGACGPEK